MPFSAFYDTICILFDTTTSQTDLRCDLSPKKASPLDGSVILLWGPVGAMTRNGGGGRNQNVQPKENLYLRENTHALETNASLLSNLFAQSSCSITPSVCGAPIPPPLAAPPPSLELLPVSSSCSLMSATAASHWYESLVSFVGVFPRI